MNAIDVVGTGFTVLDRIYVGDGSAMEELGGSCGNVLISLALLGVRVAPVLSLGADEVGQRLVEALSAAGAQTRFINRREGRSSPILVQHLDTTSGHHRFSSTCPETNEDLPRFEPIRREDVQRALPALADCKVFYTDRLSEEIVEAMEAAATAGALVFVEPSDVGRGDLFARALATATVLKFSAERLGDLAERIELPDRVILLTTHGEAGLDIRKGRHCRRCRAFPVPVVRDTCGSGDMVSVGLIDWLVTSRAAAKSALDLDDVVPGVVAGQRLAAENCSYEGARGLFRQRGAEFARTVLSTPSWA